MAGFQSLNTLPLFDNAFSIVTDALGNQFSFRDRQNLEQQALLDLQARQDAGMQNLEERAALERAQISAQADAAEKKRRGALRRSVARKRAQFGSSGLASSSGGSSEAVLLGLFNESDDQREERERLDALRFGAIDQNLANQRRLNLIQRTQLQQRQQVGNLSNSLNRFSGFVNTGIRIADFYRG